MCLLSLRSNGSDHSSDEVKLQIDFVDVSTTSSTNSDRKSDFDGTIFLESLLNLEGEDSDWNGSEANFEFDSGFSSPSYKTSFSPLTPLQDKKTQFDLSSELDFDGDQPLFWPFERKFDSEDTNKRFSMSPRKVISNIQIPRKAFSEPVRSKTRARKVISNIEIPTQTRLAFSEPAKTKTRARNVNPKNEHKQSVVKNNTQLARVKLRRSSKVVPLDIPTDGEVIFNRNTKSVNEDTSFLGEEEYFGTNEDFSIEKVLGLCEFDGHEGIDSDFNYDVFFLDDCL